MDQWRFWKLFPVCCKQSKPSKQRHEEEKITKAFVYAIFKVINKLINYYSQHSHIDKIETLYAIYKQVIDLAEVSFEGEPLTVCKLWAFGKSCFGFRNRDYHFDEWRKITGRKIPKFIHSLWRETGIGFANIQGKRRDLYLSLLSFIATSQEYLLALQYRKRRIGCRRKKPVHHAIGSRKATKTYADSRNYNSVLPETAYQPMVIPKSEAVMLRLKEIADTDFHHRVDELHQEPDSILFPKNFAHQRSRRSRGKYCAEHFRDNYPRNLEGFIWTFYW